MRGIQAGVAVVVLFVLPGGVQAAPRQLLGKSVIVAWTDQIEERAVGSEKTYFMQISRTRTAYVSTAKRVFVKATNSNRTGAKLNEMAPTSDPAQLAFRGDQLVGHALFTGFARRLTISFDPGFTSCSAAVQYGRSGGARIWQGLTDPSKKFELLSVSAGAATCQVQDGNAAAS